MLLWIAEDGPALTATRIQPDESGVFRAEVPAGSGRLHYPTPETEDEPPPDWPVLGEATVPRGETGTLRVLLDED